MRYETDMYLPKTWMELPKTRICFFSGSSGSDKSLKIGMKNWRKSSNWKLRSCGIGNVVELNLD